MVEKTLKLNKPVKRLSTKKMFIKHTGFKRKAKKYRNPAPIKFWGSALDKEGQHILKQGPFLVIDKIPNIFFTKRPVKYFVFVTLPVIFKTAYIFFFYYQNKLLTKAIIKRTRLFKQRPRRKTLHDNQLKSQSAKQSNRVRLILWIPETFGNNLKSSGEIKHYC